MERHEPKKPEIDRESLAADVGDEHPSTSADALLWLELADGAAREALAERLAQAHLFDPAHVVAHSVSTARNRRRTHEVP